MLGTGWDPRHETLALPSSRSQCVVVSRSVFQVSTGPARLPGTSDSEAQGELQLWLQISGNQLDFGGRQMAGCHQREGLQSQSKDQPEKKREASKGLIPLLHAAHRTGVPT